MEKHIDWLLGVVTGFSLCVILGLSFAKGEELPEVDPEAEYVIRPIPDTVIMEACAVQEPVVVGPEEWVNYVGKKISGSLAFYEANDGSLTFAFNGIQKVEPC